MNYQFSKLLDESSSSSPQEESLQERCAPFCDPEKIQSGTTCPGRCLSICWKICSLTFFPPPPPFLPDHTNTYHNPDQRPGEILGAPIILGLVALAICILILVLLAVAIAIFTFLRRALYSSRSSEPLGLESQAQEDHGGGHDEPEVDHPIWYIRSVGLKSSEIRLITVCKYKKGDDDDRARGTLCAVCLNEFEDNENLRLLPVCKHAFHITCIDKWLASHTNCPMCRAAVVINPAVFLSPKKRDDNHSVALEEIQGGVPGDERGFEMDREHDFPESSVEYEAEGESRFQSAFKSNDQDLLRL